MEKLKRINNFNQKNWIWKISKIRILSFFWILFWVLFFSPTFSNEIFLDSWIDSIHPLRSDNLSTIYFKYWNNNYEWAMFWKDFINLSTWVSIKTENLRNEVICHKQIRWFYFNPARWEMLRPLDMDTLSGLRVNNTTYNNINLTWWWFFDCEWVDKNNIYWQIKHNLYNINEYFLVAWTEMDYDNNNYYQHLTWSLQYTRFAGHIWDSIWWISEVNTWVATDSPDNFTLKDIVNAELNVYYKSEPIKISWLYTGKKTLAMITKWELFINWEEVWSMWLVQNDDVLNIWMWSDKNYNTIVNSYLIIGVKYDIFSIKTMKDEQFTLTTSEKMQILGMLTKLKNRYTNDPPRQKLFLKEYKEKVKEQLDEMQIEIDNQNTLYKQFNIKKLLILEYMYEKIEEMLDEMREVWDIYTAPNSKKYTIIFDPENLKCQYTAEEFIIKKCFYTYEKLINYINANNPKSNWFVTKDIIVAPNWKTYYVVEVAKWLWTCSNFLKKRYFTSLTNLQNYIKKNNPAPRQRTHTADTSFDNIFYTAPNGKEYEISKTTSWQYYSDNFQTPKYFSSLEEIKKHIDVNNKK